MDGWDMQLQALGQFIRAQRQVADLSLRELAALTSVSNAYLSQLERGRHQPSLSVLRAIATALGIPPAALLAQVGLLDEQGPPGRPASASTEEAIRADENLTESEKEALLAVYRSYLAGRSA